MSFLLFWPQTAAEYSVSTGLSQGLLKLILPLAVVALVKPQIKTRNSKKCEKIKGFAENGKSKNYCIQSRVFLIKSGDIEGKVSGNAPSKSQVQPGALEGDQFLTLYLCAL